MHEPVSSKAPAQSKTETKWKYISTKMHRIIFASTVYKMSQAELTHTVAYTVECHSGLLSEPDREMTSRKLRVAIINNVFAHYRSALIRELRSSKAVEYHFFADRDGNSGIPAVALRNSHDFTYSPFFRVLGKVAWQPRALATAWSGDYDCFIFLGDAAWISTWVAAAVARLRGRRVLFWTHGWIRRDQGAKKYLRLAFYKLADGLLLYAQRAAQIGIDLGYDPNKLHVISNSLDFDAQRELAKAITPAESTLLKTRLFGDADTPVVIATARLTTVKRFDLLIAALKIVNRDSRAVNLLVVGDGPERNRLETLATDTGIKAAFVGACYDEAQLAAYFLAANVTVSPGNVGLTCMHSLGYGVPVITHDDPDYQMPEWEAIEIGVTGDIFRNGSAADLAQKVEKWTRTNAVTEETRIRCWSTIEKKWHPQVQAGNIEKAVHLQQA